MDTIEKDNKHKYNIAIYVCILVMFNIWWVVFAGLTATYTNEIIASTCDYTDNNVCYLYNQQYEVLTQCNCNNKYNTSQVVKCYLSDDKKAVYMTKDEVKANSVDYNEMYIITVTLCSLLSGLGILACVMLLTATYYMNKHGANNEETIGLMNRDYV